MASAQAKVARSHGGQGRDGEAQALALRDQLGWNPAPRERKAARLGQRARHRHPDRTKKHQGPEGHPGRRLGQQDSVGMPQTDSLHARKG